jgi:hypothetical protein
LLDHAAALQYQNAMPDDDKANETQRGALIAAAAVVVLMIVGLFLAHSLSASSRLQDCLMSGRTNCAPIQSPN